MKGSLVDADIAVRSRCDFCDHHFQTVEAQEDEAATFVHKIFNGVKPADIPVEQPTKFELRSTKRPPKRWA